MERPSDHPVGRVGGDEFFILQAGSEPSSAKYLAERISSAFAQPFEISGAHGETLGSVSALPFIRVDGRDGELLLKVADAALHRVKRIGGGAMMAA